jgi:iron(III) transport system substrate-binding protein
MRAFTLATSIDRSRARCGFSPGRIATLVVGIGRLLSCFALFGFAQASLAVPFEAKVLAQARAEGAVVVYGTTDLAAAQPLIRDFEALHPGINVDYRELDSAECHRRFSKEYAEGTATADVVWSSAMDLQVKLVNDGHAMRYRSTEIDHLPPWSVWRTEAYGTTFEPLGLAYNERLIPQQELPRTHADLARFIVSGGSRFTDKVLAYDLANAGLGFLVATQDARASPAFWDIARAMGRAGVRMQPSTSAMLDRIASGQSLLAYNVLGSYSHRRALADPSIGLVYLKDYTLVVSRIAFINRRAAHPNAARLWLDHLLSRRGQTVLAQQSRLFSLRDDVPGEQTAAALKRMLGDSLKPIAIGPSLMVYLDRTKRAEFLKEWDRALTPGKP